MDHFDFTTVFSQLYLYSSQAYYGFMVVVCPSFVRLSVRNLSIVAKRYVIGVGVSVIG